MRKYFMELFAMGFVDSEGNLVEENVLRDAQIGRESDAEFDFVVR